MWVGEDGVCVRVEIKGRETEKKKTKEEDGGGEGVRNHCDIQAHTTETLW